ncbi:MAG TPA: outer membrane beta-barrel protein [Reyranella sp.]|nr:outer membrane beta-barrel protein [Reyranella sp.]
MFSSKLGRFLAAGTAFALSAFGFVSKPQAQSNRWDGFYAGINAGVSTANDALTNSTQQNSVGGLATAQQLGFLPLKTAPNSGFIGGVQAGYGRILFDGFYVGGETDFQWLNASTTVASSPVILGQQLSTWISRSQTWLGTTRAKVGFTPMSYLLLYGTGGLAYGDSRLNVSITSANTAPPVASAQSSLQTRLGYTLGAGFEFTAWGPLSVKGEWLYYDFGQTNVTTGYVFAGSSMTTTVLENGHIFRAGLNYRF